MSPNIKEAIRVLKAGGVIVFPTETSYGIGCDADNAKAVRRVFDLKGRVKEKGVPLIVSSLAMAKRYGVFSKTALALAKAHWPGPLTIVVPTESGQTIALRVSSHPIAAALTRALGRPIVATSANLSGHPSAFSVKKIPFKGVFVVDGGTLPKCKPSTLVRVIGDHIEVLRQGKVKL